MRALVVLGMRAARVLYVRTFVVLREGYRSAQCEDSGGVLHDPCSVISP